MSEVEVAKFPAHPAPRDRTGPVTNRDVCWLGNPLPPGPLQTARRVIAALGRVSGVPRERRRGKACATCPRLCGRSRGTTKDVSRAVGWAGMSPRFCREQFLVSSSRRESFSQNIFLQVLAAGGSRAHTHTYT